LTANAALEWQAGVLGANLRDDGGLSLAGLVRHFCEPLSGDFVHHADETFIDYLIHHGFGVWLPNLLGSDGAEC
jgi:hypothetical protein